MDKMYLLVCYSGNDQYDHSRRHNQVGVETCLEEDIETKFAAYKKHCEQRLVNGGYAWAVLNVLRLTIDGSVVTRHWARELPVKQRIKLNERALSSPPPKKKSFDTIAEEIQHTGLQHNFWADIPLAQAVTQGTIETTTAVDFQ